MLLKAVYIKGVWGAVPRSHSSCADDKAPGDLIPQMLALNLLENKIINMIFRPLYPVSANGFQREIKVKGQRLDQVSNTLEQLFHMAQNQKFSQGLNKPLQLLKSGSQFVEIATYLLDQRCNRSTPLSFQ